MNTKFDLTEMSANIVYLKPMNTEDLPEGVREQAGDMEQIFAVHNRLKFSKEFEDNRVASTHTRYR